MGNEMQLFPFVRPSNEIGLPIARFMAFQGESPKSTRIPQEVPFWLLFAHLPLSAFLLAVCPDNRLPMTVYETIQTSRKAGG